MDNNEIIDLFGVKEHKDIFSGIPQIKLNAIYSFLKIHFQKGNHWNQTEFISFCAQNNIGLRIATYHLKNFVFEYSNRKKKKCKTLFSFVNKLKSNRIIHNNYYPRKDLSLNKSLDLSKFLKTIQELGYCINENDKTLVYKLNSIIHTGLSNETLLRYYYQRNQERY